MDYLDNAATTRPHPEVLKIVNDCFTNFGNPSSIYQPGIKARELINNARNQLATAFRVPEAGIIFCGSGTESDNLALKGLLDVRDTSPKRMITTRLEHSAVIKTAEWLQEHGVFVDFVRIAPKTGQVDLDHLAELVVPETRIVSIQHVNSETGIIQDLTAISAAIKAKNPKTLLHSDGVQAFSKFPMTLNELGVDLYSISGHKFHGIKGAGALIVSKPLPLKPIIHGGGQESGLRSGTENVAAIAAMGMAAELAMKSLQENYQQVASFSEKFIAAIKLKFPDLKIIEGVNAVPHIISLSFPRILGEVLLNHLAREEIYVATGSACNAGSKNLSAVLREMGFSSQRIRETVRISLAASEIAPQFEAFFNRFYRVVEDLYQIV